MSLSAALIYWLIVSIWLTVLMTISIAFLKNRQSLGTSKLLLTVVAIDTARNIFENIYFGIYFGGQYGLFDLRLTSVLGRPDLLIIPKLVNVVAAGIVLVLLVYRWLPRAQQEKANAAVQVRRTIEALDQEAEEHRRLFDTSVDLIIVTDEHRVIKRISKSCEHILGYRADELLHRYGGELISPNDIGMLRSRVANTMLGNPLQNVHCSFLHRDGHHVPLAISGVWSEQAQRYFLIGRDMTASNAAAKALRDLAHTDQLTKLPNRTSLVDDLDEHLSLLEPNSSFALVMFDLDGFKDVNDSLGHSIGDRLLFKMASRLRQLAPPDAVVYRFGGDEFFMLLKDHRDPLIATNLSNEIIKGLSEPLDIEGHRVSVGASAGIAFAPRDATDSDELMVSADLALYEAKNAGRGKSRLFQTSMRSTAQAKLQLEAEFRTAVEQNQFILYFQPQMRTIDKKVVGVESLLRWQHPQRGLLMPHSFLDALTASGCAVDVGKWALREACATAALWRSKGLPPIRMAVNLFPSQFDDGLLVADVKMHLDTYGLEPNSLELEVTENIVLSNSAILPTLQELRSLGVQIAFDDFGTGFASLSCIAQYPLTRIKIDRSFVRNIRVGSTARDTAIASSVILMAHSLDLSVTAEGVETEAQALFLRSKHCDEVQGYRYARPLPAHDMERFLGVDHFEEFRQFA